MAQLLLANPRKRRAPAKRRAAARKTTTRRVRRRRNPIKGDIMTTVKNGAIGAAGAAASAVVVNKVPFLSNLDGNMKHAAKAAVGIGLGMAVSKFGKNRALGQNMAEGAIVVALYQLAAGTGFGQQFGLGYGGDLLGAYEMGAYEMGAANYNDGAGDDYSTFEETSLLGASDPMDDLLGYTSPAEVSAWDYDEEEDLL